MDIQIGQSVGPYRIISQIGQGGMATVYKAYHAAMDRYVAVKVLPRQLAESPEFIGRFQQEARTIARLEHPHILPVHDYGESDGITYLVMRYLDAGTLKERLQASPLALAEIDRVFTQLAEALDYAHSLGIVHRDLKPSNVLLDARGSVFLTDFGIAKLLESNVQFTGTGGLIGTPAYMSPEQAQGLRVDQRSDIYCLGIILYEMVTGRVPFEAETPLAVILKHLNEPLPLPSTVKPDISPAVERVILKALSKNPDDRFATTAEFVAAWKQALAEDETLRASVPLPGEVAVPTIVAPAPGAPGQPTRTAPISISPPTVAAAAPPAAPARPTRRFGPLGLVAAGGIGLLVLAICGGLAVTLLLSQASPTATVPSAEATATVAEIAATAPAPEDTATPEPPATAEPVAGTDSRWTSWAAANAIYTLAAMGDQIITGGPGGLTVWNALDGTVIGRVTTGDGLPDPYVNVVLADEEDQRVWVGTGDGLLAFDGEKATIYSDEDGLDSSTVRALARTSWGLLAGTEYSGVEGGGLNVFTDNGWQPFPDFPSAYPDEQPDKLANSVTALLEDDLGLLWVGTWNGLGLFDGQTWTRFSTDDGLPDNTITALMFEDGILWVGTYGGVVQFDGVLFTPVEALQGTTPYGMLLASSGEYWFAGDGGIARFDPGAANWDFYEYTDLPSYTLYGGVEGQDGSLYFGSEHGLVRFDGSQFDVWTVPNVPTEASFGRILPAPDGRLLFVEEYGTYVDAFDPAARAWSQFPELPCEYCAPLAFGPEGTLWAGSDLGLWIITRQEATHWTTEFGLPADLVNSVAFELDVRRAWIATEAGVAVLDGQAVTEVFNAENTGLASDYIRFVFAGSDGSMWVGTDTNLSRRGPGGAWFHYTTGDPFSYDVRVNDIAEDHSGAIWIATAGDGVYRYAEGNWQQFYPDDPGVELPSGDVNSVTVAPDGSLWFGTYYAGAAHFDGAEWSVFDVDAAAGLIHPNVNDIYVDESGAAWFATSGGVTRYAP